MTSVEFQHGAGGALRARRASNWQILAPRLAEWLLLAVIAFLLARAAIAFFAPLPLPKGEPLVAAKATQQEAAPTVALNPFFTSAVAPTDVVPVTADVEETALDLTLNGVWPSSENPSAIIRLEDGKQHRFTVGEEIVSGARLVAVYSDQVIIERNGVQEALRFENKAVVERPAPDAAPNEKIFNESFGPAIDRIVRFGLGADPRGGMAIVMFAGTDRTAFERAGFRDGDIVRAINGAAPSGNRAEMSALINQINQAGAATVVIERDGDRKTISFSLSQSGNE